MVPGKYEPWTPTEDRAIRRGVAAGRNFGEIAGELRGRTRWGVRQRFQRLKETGGAPGKRHAFTPAEDRVLAGGVAARLTCAQIAAKLPGRTYSEVWRRFDRLKRPAAPAPAPARHQPEKERAGAVCVAWTADDDAIVKAGLEAGESWGDIAERLPGRSVDSVRSRTKRLADKSAGDAAAQVAKGRRASSGCAGPAHTHMSTPTTEGRASPPPPLGSAAQEEGAQDEAGGRQRRQRLPRGGTPGQSRPHGSP